MIHFIRPSKPDKFDTDPVIVRARESIRKIVARGRPPRSKNFPHSWSTHKSVFAEAQYDKCGFCESKVLVIDYGVVEHFRPKAEVRDLPVDRAGLGVPRPHAATLNGRIHGPLISDYGYWWLAYTWENWLFACTVCNSVYKGNIWPILESPRAEHCEHCEHCETHLLLSPFDGPNPVKHLAYSRDGQISQRNQSRLGSATIDTCGLDRFELTQERRGIAREVFALLEGLELAPTEACRLKFLDDIESLGHAREKYAGMVRSIVEVYLECDWDQCFGA